MDFQLNPELNLEQITKDFSADHRVQINDLLPVEQAAHLSQCLAEKITYKQAFVVDGNFGEASLEQLNDLKVEDRDKLLNDVNQQAASGVGFWYERNVIQANDTELTGDLFKWLNSDALLETVANITGTDKCSGATAQSTRYKPGDFLTRNKSDATEEKRKLAFVMNLSPRWHADWGGMLQFYQPDATPRDTWSPNFNSLALFDVSHIHSVTYVAPFAQEPQLAIRGWFVG